MAEIEVKEQDGTFNPTISTITLNVNSLNIPIKARYWEIGLIFLKARPK